MSVLSPVATAILNTLQSNSKSDDNVEGGAFLSLLAAGDDASQAVVKSDLALINTLYAGADDKVAIAVPLPTVEFVDNEQTAAAPTVVSSRGDNQDDKKALLVAQVTGKPLDDVRQKNDKLDAKDRDAEEGVDVKESLYSASSSSVSKVVSSVDRVSKEPAKSEVILKDDEVLQKLQEKIDLLSDILASLAAMLGVGNVSQLTMVQVKQTVLTLTQQSLGVNQPFIDLSDRFDQLIAAVTASQNLSDDALGGVFYSFQQLVVSLMSGGAAGIDNAEVLKNCSICETDLDGLLKNLPMVENDVADMGKLGEQLRKLGAWLGEVQALVSSKAVAAHNMGENILAAVNSRQTAIIAGSQPVMTAMVTPVVQKITIGKNEDEIVNAVSSSAAFVASNVVSVSPHLQNFAPNAGMVVTAENNAAAMFGNTGNENSGQGGERPAGAINSFATLGATNSNGVGSSSFSKILKATTQAVPLADQVLFNIKTAVKDGTSKIQIQLDPLELGKLHIKIDLSVDGKATGVVVTADNKSTLEMLQRDARGLEAALADAGIKADAGSLSFNLRGGDSGKGREEAPNVPYTGYTNLVAEEGDLAPLAVISRSYVVNINDGLDIQI